MMAIAHRAMDRQTVAHRAPDPRTGAASERQAAAPGVRLQRRAACACGGSCPRCTSGAEPAETAVANAGQSAGAPLPAGIRAGFEASLGTDLSSVRLHSGSASAAANEAVAARAYTVGDHIHFNTGQLRPGEPDGLHLLAHEVAHTVQQSRGTPGPQHRLQVSLPGDAAELAADRAADAMLAGQPAAAHVGAAPVGLQRQEAPAAAPPPPKPGGFMWVVFDESGGWDAADILMRMSQLEGTPTPTPDYLPGANEESDRKRCGSNAALASAIVAGPAQVIELCRSLLERIKRYKALGMEGAAEMPGATQADRASASVSRILREVFYGTRGMAHEGGGGTLQYRDLDTLAHWLYVFSYNPDDPGRVAGRGGVGSFQGEGRRWRSPEEIADAATMAGYGGGSWNLMRTWEGLMERIDALPDGGSLLVIVSNDPRAVDARYIHTITFFKQAGVAYVHDSWGAGKVYPSTDPKFRESVRGAYDDLGGLKPRALYVEPPAPPPSMLDDWLLRH